MSAAQPWASPKILLSGLALAIMLVAISCGHVGDSSTGGTPATDAPADAPTDAADDRIPFGGPGLLAADGFDHSPSKGVQCVDCHNLHNGPLIPKGLDLLIACKACHNPTGSASTKTKIAHHGTSKGSVECGKCHDPHRSTAPLADNIRPKLRYSTALTSVDYPATTPRKYVAAASPYNGVCEVCHTSTSYHRNNVSGDHLHNKSTSCVSCHTHEEGFMPSCSGCHDKAQGSRRAILPSNGNPNDFGNTSHHVVGNVKDSDCVVCHYMGTHRSGTVRLQDPDQGSSLIYNYSATDPGGIEGFCLNCHDADGAKAGNGTTPFSDGVTVPDIVGAAGSQWKDSAHKKIGYPSNGGKTLTCMGDGSTTGCHGNAHGSANIRLLNAPASDSIDKTCFKCHTDGKITNNALSGSGLANDIEQAFAMSRKHDMGSTFSRDGRTYILQCTTCHNPHVVTGKHWSAEQGVSSITRPDLSADPLVNPRAMGKTLWGAKSGEKMDDFAAKASGTGGWYYNVARGIAGGATNMPFDQPAVYQPPKTSAGGWSWEYGGQDLPDYPSFCLDCHSYKMSESVYPVNWGQGIPWNYTGNPTTWVTARSPHGLGSANRPYAWAPSSTFYGGGGNPDPIFQQSGVQRGRGAGQFTRWPYDPANKNAGINFVLSCTDCHEAHGSPTGRMLRTIVNKGPGTPNWNTMCNNCHFYYGYQHRNKSCAYASCHEQQSIHRIKKNGEYSGGIFQWAAPSRPTTTPEIQTVTGSVGSYTLQVKFTASVYTNKAGTGALVAKDFVLTDVDGNNPRTIVSVAHTAGASTAVITMSKQLTTADLAKDLLATRGLAVWDAFGNPAGPWTVKIQ